METIDYYKLVLKKIPYSTIIELFRLENEIINGIVISGISFMFKRKFGIHPIDSTGFNFANNLYSENETIINIGVIFDFENNIKNCVVDDEWVTVKILEQKINISTSKVLLVKFKIKYLLSNFS